jgi:hypothetical protein
MYHQQPLPVAAVAALLLLAPPAARQPIACSLLTESQVNAALEVKSLPGKPPFPTAQKLCMWSDDPKGGINNRRVTLSLMTRAAFDVGRSNKQLKIEPVSGIGDEAYYEVFSSDAPLLVVRKGSSAFNIRILNGLKFKPFAVGQVKAKEGDLAKAAVAKL